MSVTVALVGCGVGVEQEVGPSFAQSATGLKGDLRVGHTTRQIVVPGSALGESRKVTVHLWYPAAGNGFEAHAKTVYKPGIHGMPVPAQWDPLLWTIEAELARENAPINSAGPAYPVIVFSHGSVNDPIDYAYTLELIAGAGFVVAAPYHVNNTQDDARKDFLNQQAGFTVFTCDDGRPGPCNRPNIPLGMKDRARDVSAILDNIPAWFGDRADVGRAGVMGHSRGTVTALAVAGGSTTWGFAAEPRVKAIMGMAIGAPALTFATNVANITVPTLLVAGGLDALSPQAVSEAAFDAISSTEKAFVSITKAHHRTFDSTYCDQTQSAGSLAQATTRAILDLHTTRINVVNPVPGRATDFCTYATFTDPNDIRPIVSTLSGITPTPTNVPVTGLDTDEVKEGMKELAVTFFGTTLKRTGNDGVHFQQYLAPKWLEKHEPMVGRAEAFASADALCPPGQDVVCAD